ncbi:hypothetical protein ABEB36_002158 [Hypothenemus hampei]|uniref:GH18 domain-containing protein n=1 Tax=Hypothenemus hampei TaxID=57062 RepID=A0ABD1F4R9_HYPHA
MCKVLLGILALAYTCAQVASVAVVCYYSSYNAYNGITPEKFDAHLCTHINYAFILLNEDGSLKVADKDMDVDQKLYLRVTGMKERNSNLKVLLSVGGYSVSAAFKGIASDPNKRAIFVKSSLSYLETYNFDGLDIDWEYPEEEDRETYILLLKELKEAFEAKGYLLTAAVNSKLEQHAYNLADMLKYLDFINIMCYDFYGSWSDYTGQNSALYASSVETAAEKRSLNVEAAANKWVTAGAPKSKLAIGTAFYGRSFTLSNPNNHGIHAPITGAGEDGGEDHYVTVCV